VVDKTVVDVTYGDDVKVDVGVEEVDCEGNEVTFHVLHQMEIWMDGDMILDFSLPDRGNFDVDY